jgi:hypothetical protein
LEVYTDNNIHWWLINDGLDYFPNSIGAIAHSGRLFRIDASAPTGKQYATLTHQNTRSNSAPHADSRAMRVAPNGVLIEADDGGIYARTQPQRNGGDWISLNGDLQITELHSIAWDANSEVILGGAQDNGSMQQRKKSDSVWQSVFLIPDGDGGCVAVDDFEYRTSGGISIRYSSGQNLGSFRYRTFDKTNLPLIMERPLLTVIGGQQPINKGTFYTPIQVNKAAPSRLIIGAANGVYESVNKGHAVDLIGPNVSANNCGSIAYGAVAKPDILYVGSGKRVYVRTATHPAPLNPSPIHSGAKRIVGVAVNPDDWRTAYWIDATDVYRTSNAGAQKPTKITGNLPMLRPGELHSVTYSTSADYRGVVVGGSNGVFIKTGSQWSRLGNGMPTALVMQMAVRENIIVAGTLGRGAWILDVSGP